jgi:hypothetical protein
MVIFTDKDSVIKKFGSLSSVPKFELFDFDFLDQLAEYKVPSFLAGFVRLSPHAIKAMSQSTGVDLKSFFKQEQWEMDGDKRYSDKEIAYYYFELAKRARKSGVRFNTCYIGNGEKDYYQYQDLWSNKGDCCDAKGNIKAFKSSSQEIDWKTRLKQASCKDDAKESQKEELEYAKTFSKVIEKNKSYYPENGVGYTTDAEL